MSKSISDSFNNRPSVLSLKMLTQHHDDDVGIDCGLGLRKGSQTQLSNTKNKRKEIEMDVGCEGSLFEYAISAFGPKHTKKALEMGGMLNSIFFVGPSAANPIHGTRCLGACDNNLCSSLNISKSPSSSKIREISRK